MDTALWIVIAAALLTAIMTGAGALLPFLFVETFRPFLPVGLGLEAGAMIWMVFSELYPDALEKVDHGSAATAVTLDSSFMMTFQLLVLAH